MPDVIIVGGGSAGAVLAARLSQDPARTVLLLEAGPVYAPDAYPKSIVDADVVADPAHDWGYTTRGTPTPRGKVLGGSSAVNAGVALRARAADFAGWPADWSFDDVLPTYKLLENTPTGDDAFHGRGGPLSIRQRTLDELTPSLRAFVEASVAHGFKRVHDFNGAEQNGADGYPMDVVDGIRQNTGLAYLTAGVRSRANLTIVGGVNVDRVLFSGTIAVGVIAADGTEYRGSEVILSGGAYGSPAILLRSGVGPAGDLAALGIDVVADLPVGQRLQDQPGYYNAYALAPSHLEMSPAVGSLLWTASSEAIGDELDLHVTATHLMPGSASPTGGAIVLMAALVRPESTGTLRLASRDPEAAPVIDPNYLGSERDLRRMVEGVELGRAIARNPVFAPFVAAELAPGPDDSVAEVVAANVAVYGHPTSTAPMGDVVDSLGAVHGVSGLRVVDAAIIPVIPSSTTNVTVIMLAERIYQRVYGGRS